MPTYEYKCSSCRHRFEEFQRITEDPLTRCPKCGKKSLKRLIGGGMGIIFKGSGFYSTDHKKSSASTGSVSGSNGSTSKSGESGGSKDSAADSGPKGEAKSGSSGKGSPGSGK